MKLKIYCSYCAFLRIHILAIGLFFATFFLTVVFFIRVLVSLEWPIQQPFMVLHYCLLKQDFLQLLFVLVG